MDRVSNHALEVCRPVTSYLEVNDRYRRFISIKVKGSIIVGITQFEPDAT